LDYIGENDRITVFNSVIGCFIAATPELHAGPSVQLKDAIQGEAHFAFIRVTFPAFLLHFGASGAAATSADVEYDRTNLRALLKAGAYSARGWPNYDQICRFDLRTSADHVRFGSIDWRATRSTSSPLRAIFEYSALKAAVSLKAVNAIRRTGARNSVKQPQQSDLDDPFRDAGSGTPSGTSLPAPLAAQNASHRNSLPFHWTPPARMSSTTYAEG
jgi:hypothetical protein